MQIINVTLPNAATTKSAPLYQRVNESLEIMRRDMKRTRIPRLRLRMDCDVMTGGERRFMHWRCGLVDL